MKKTSQSLKRKRDPKQDQVEEVVDDDVISILSSNHEMVDDEVMENQEEEEEEEMHEEDDSEDSVESITEQMELGDLLRKITRTSHFSPSYPRLFKSFRSKLAAAIHFMVTKYVPQNLVQMNSAQKLDFAKSLFDIEPDDKINVEAVQATLTKERDYLSTLESCLVYSGIVTVDDNDPRNNEEAKIQSYQAKAKLEIVRASLESAGRFVLEDETLGRLAHPNFFEEYAKNNTTKIGKFEQAMDFFIREAVLYNYRRYGGEIYEEVKHSEDASQRTNAYVYKMTMDEFVHIHVQNSPEIRSIVYVGSKYSDSVATMLRKHAKFPTIIPNRHLSSYINGMFNSKTKVFYPWHEVRSSMISCRFYPLIFYLSEETVGPRYMDTYIEEQVETKRTLDAHPWAPQAPLQIEDTRPFVNNWYLEVGATQNHQVLDPTVEGGMRPRYWSDYTNWYDIPTPCFQRLLDFQDMDRNTARWIYVMLGRLQFEVNELDKWQVQLFLKGAAGTGKSTIIKMAQMLYQHTDVAILSNNIEKKFGLQTIYDKMLYVCCEVKSDFGLTQSEWQSMVTGEGMSIAVKGKAQVQLSYWKVPGILAGNELPGYVDASGSFSRRNMLAEFPNKIPAESAAMHLDEMLEREMAAFRYKCTMAYHQAVEVHGHAALSAALPIYFQNTNKALKAASNPLVGFLSDDVEVRITHEVDDFISWKDFAAAFDAYCRGNNLKMISLVPDSTNAIFKDFRIHITKSEPRFNSKGVPVVDRYLVGIKFTPQE